MLMTLRSANPAKNRAHRLLDEVRAGGYHSADAVRWALSTLGELVEKNDGHLRNLQSLATQSQPSNGTATNGSLCAGVGVDISTAAAHMRETQAGSGRSCKGACGLAGEGVSA
jgi:hypothetical protein